MTDFTIFDSNILRLALMRVLNRILMLVVALKLRNGSCFDDLVLIIS